MICEKNGFGIGKQIREREMPVVRNRFSEWFSTPAYTVDNQYGKQRMSCASCSLFMLFGRGGAHAFVFFRRCTQFSSAARSATATTRCSTL